MPLLCNSVVNALQSPCRISCRHRTQILYVKQVSTENLHHQQFLSSCPSALSSHIKCSRSAARAATPVVMVMTESTPFCTGTKTPPFELPEPLTGKTHTLEEISQGAAATLVMWISNHCPFVKLLKEGIVDLAKDYQEKGVAIVAISSNSIKTHPQDGPEQMAVDAREQGYTFPYLFDETQEVAEAYKALCTPEFMVFDKNLELQYHGQFDSARPSRDVPVTGEDLRAALDDILTGKPVGRPIKPSVGCNIKWHP